MFYNADWQLLEESINDAWRKTTRDASDGLGSAARCEVAWPARRPPAAIAVQTTAPDK
jgi:hypothetical protein